MRVAALLLSFLLLAGTPPVRAGDSQVYVCPMEEHPQEFDHPGTCPICGMELVSRDRRLRVAVLLFDGAEIIDYAAPWEVFGQVGARVFTVAPRAEIIRSVFGLPVKPDFDLDHAPAADVLLVPGGGIGPVVQDAKTIEWVRSRAASSRFVLSVCNGAFILAKAGLLEGLSATTTASHLDELAAASPRTRVVRDKRFVDNGSIITSGGLSAGLDGALHLVDRIYGRVRAEEVARGIEYHWQPESSWARGALADALLPEVRLPEGTSWQKLANHGDTTRWEVRGTLKLPMEAEAFLDLSAKQVAASGWKMLRSAKGERTFAKTDRAGRRWRTTFRLTAGDEPRAFLETMTIKKVAPAR